MKIAVIGCGGVGGYFGGKLCQILDAVPELILTMIARGPHLAAIQNQGLILNTEKEGHLRCQPTIATDSLESLPPQDLILLCVKGFDLLNVLARMKDAVQDQTFILPLLNGVDIPTRIRQTISAGIVFPACVYVGTHIESPGVVTQKGGACKILYGPDPQHPEKMTDPLRELLNQASILSEWTNTVSSAIWEKFIFICSFGLVTAAYDKVLGEVMEHSDLKQTVTTIIQEIRSVATALQVPVPDSIESSALEKATTFPYETKTSFQRDFELKEKRDERELFAGSMLRYGCELGIALPTIAQIAKRLDEQKPL